MPSGDDLRRAHPFYFRLSAFRRRRRGPPPIRLGSSPGTRRRGGFAGALRRIRLRWLRIYHSRVLRRLSRFYAAALRELAEAGKAMVAFQDGPVAEGFGIPVLPVSVAAAVVSGAAGAKYPRSTRSNRSIDPSFKQLFLPWLLSTPTSTWSPPATPPAPPPPPRQGRPSASRSRSGTPSPSGPGISWWTIAQSAGTTSWTSVLSARQIKQVQLVRSALLLGEFAIMPSTSTALVAG